MGRSRGRRGGGGPRRSEEQDNQPVEDVAPAPALAPKESAKAVATPAPQSPPPSTASFDPPVPTKEDLEVAQLISKSPKVKHVQIAHGSKSPKHSFVERIHTPTRTSGDKCVADAKELEHRRHAHIDDQAPSPNGMVPRVSTPVTHAPDVDPESPIVSALKSELSSSGRALNHVAFSPKVADPAHTFVERIHTPTRRTPAGADIESERHAHIDASTAAPHGMVERELTPMSHSGHGDDEVSELEDGEAAVHPVDPKVGAPEEPAPAKSEAAESPLQVDQPSVPVVVSSAAIATPNPSESAVVPTVKKPTAHEDEAAPWTTYVAIGAAVVAIAWFSLK